MKRIRGLLFFFMVSLVVSGVTAVPVEWELTFLLNIIPKETGLYGWLYCVFTAYHTTNTSFPFLLYGYDWLFFAHLALAVFFVGPYRDPVKNIWVIEAGLIACLLVVPVAFIGGHFRGIPFWWQIVDCSFGLFGGLLLWICRRSVLLFTRSSLSLTSIKSTL